MAEAATERDDDIHHRTTAAAADDEERQSGDLYMTPATGGAASENYYTTLEGLGEAACTEDSEGGLSETPNIRSPLKPSHERQRGRQTVRDRKGYLKHHLSLPVLKL
jgi:hypothetical protein